MTRHITALGLKAVITSDAMAGYFNKCEEKLGFVPNVLKAYGSTWASSKPSCI